MVSYDNKVGVWIAYQQTIYCIYRIFCMFALSISIGN